jgi:hypothetical protein
MKIPHRESLLRIPLVDFVIHQNAAKIVERPVDNHWYYQGLLGTSTVGFNPFCGNLFCAKNSVLNKWLPDAHRSARPYNNEEWLVYESLFLVHDYLHLWTVSELIKEFDYLTGDQIVLDQKVINDLEFIYMISEAAATVGLDYWYLSKININELCPIGSRMVALTSPYREADLDRYKVFNEDFIVQDISFFHWIVNGYCGGDFYGFTVADIKKDAKLFDWLAKEITISNKQLHFIRQWLYYMAGLAVPSGSALNRAIDIGTETRRKMIDKIGRKLWDISCGTELPVMQSYQIELKSTRPVGHHDFRFKNIRVLDNWQQLVNEDFTRVSTEQFGYFTAQFLSSFCYEPSNKFTRNQINRIIASKDISALQRLTKNLSLVNSQQCGPGNLVFVN